MQTALDDYRSKMGSKWQKIQDAKLLIRLSPLSGFESKYDLNRVKSSFDQASLENSYTGPLDYNFANCVLF